MKSIIIHLCAFLLSCCPLLGYTQQQKLAYNFNTYNSDIPTTTIYPIIHDKMGNLWMATDKGVVKFDGTNFITLNTESGALYNEIIYLLYQPEENIIWGFSYYSKIVKINTLNNSFTTIDQPFKNIGPLFYAYFSDNKLQVLSQKYRLTLVNNKLVKTPHSDDFFEKYLLAFPHKIPNLNVHLFEEVKASKVHQSDMTDKTRLGKYHTIILKKEAYFSANNKIYKLLDIHELYQDVGTFIVDVEFIKDDIYIGINGKNGGIFYGKDFLKNPTASKLKRVSPIGAINSITKDRLGNIWYSLNGSGLMVINQPQLNLTSLSLSGLDNKNLIGVVNDDFVYIKNKNTTETNLLSLNNQYDRITPDVKAAILNYQNLMAIDADFDLKDISHDNSYLLKLQRVISKKSTKFVDHFTSQIKCFDRFEDQLIFFTASDSIYLYQDKIKKQASYPSMGIVNDIYFLNEKLIIFCADNGVFTSDASLNSFKEISKKRFTKVLVADGLFYFINDQNLSYLDLKKDKGIKEIFSNKHYLASFTILDFGISENKIHLLTDIGYIGLAKSMVKTAKQPIVFNLANIELKNDTLYHLQEKVNIAASNVHHLKFNLNYLNPESNFYEKSYSFTKSDSEDNWMSFIGNSFTQTNITPGNYILKIRAKLTDTSLENIMQYQIVIKPYFWQTFWFLSCCVVIAISLVSFITWFIISKQQKKKLEKIELEQKIADIENKAFLNQLNPHFLYNALNALQDYLIQKDTHNGIVYLQRVTSLHRSILDFHHKSNITVNEEKAFIEKYLFVQQKRYSDKFKYQIEVAQGAEHIKIPPMLLQPLIENTIEHGFNTKDENHSLQISFVKKEHLQITITDNGNGKLQNLMNAKEGHALYMIKERLDFINQKKQTNSNSIAFDSNLPKGIIVMITIDL